MRRYMIIGVIVAASGVGWAYSGVSEPTMTGGFSSLGFLDSSRLTINNSLVFGYARSGQKQEGSGALMTTLGYELNPRLMVRATLSKQFTFLGRGPSDEGISLSGFEMSWTPSKHLFVRVAFSSPPLRTFSDPHLMSWR